MGHDGSSRQSAADRSPGLPGLRGMDHIGLTVPDVDEAVAFFCGVLGCEEFYNLGTFSHDDSDWMTQHLNVHPRSQINNMRMIRCGHANVELFEYEAPDKRREIPQNSDNGGHHFAFYVDDIFAAVDYLKSRGIKVLGEPTLNGGAEEGEYWCYFLSPWGMQLELVSYPEGRGYEREFAGRLWDPRDPNG